MRNLLTVLALVAMAGAPLGAQWVVHDAAVTAKNSVTAVVTEHLLNTQRQQHERIRRMAARLSAVTDLVKYVVPAAPPWDRMSTAPLYSGAYDRAVASGESTIAAYESVVQPFVSESLPDRRWGHGRRALTSRWATVDIADAATLSAMEAIGRARTTGGEYEGSAVLALERYVTDPSSTQSATAVLDKIGGAGVIAARQRQTRLRLLTGLLEQLLVDGKRVRDAEASAINMQLTTLRDAHAVNHAFVAGTGHALQSWRQP